MWGHACVAVICCAACACGRCSVTLSVRCFRLLSSMCRTSEIDGRGVHLRGSDRCEISYAATLTRSMCRSTFEDPIDVNFIIMLLYSCIYANYAEGLHFSAFHYYINTMEALYSRHIHLNNYYINTMEALYSRHIHLNNYCINTMEALYSRHIYI